MACNCVRGLLISTPLACVQDPITGCTLSPKKLAVNSLCLSFCFYFCTPPIPDRCATLYSVLHCADPLGLRLPSLRTSSLALQLPLSLTLFVPLLRTPPLKPLPCLIVQSLPDCDRESSEVDREGLSPDVTTVEWKIVWSMLKAPPPAVLRDKAPILSRRQNFQCKLHREVKEDDDFDVWVMDSEGKWTHVPDAEDPESPILYAPVPKPKRPVADSKEAAAQAYACPIEEEVPNSDEDEDKYEDDDEDED